MKKNLIVSSILVVSVSTIFLANIYLHNSNNNKKTIDISKVNTISFPGIAGEIPENVNFKIDSKATTKINNLSELKDSKTLPKVVKVKALTDISKRKSKLKQIFNINNSVAESKDSANNLSSFKDNNKKLDVFNDGVFSYHMDSENNAKENKLSDDTLKKTATSFLSTNELLPSDYSFDKIQFETETSATDPSKSKILRKFINFTRKIDGVPVYGYSKITVGINATGEISDLYYLAKDQSDSGNIEIKSFDTAFTDLKKENGLINMASDTKDVDIKDVEVAYWEDSSPNSTQEYIQPVYRFTGDAINEKGERSDFVGIIRAIPENKTNTITPKLPNLESTPKTPKNQK